jgi:hypothetical protein
LNSSTVLIVAEAIHPSNEIGARRATALARYLAVCGIRVVVVSAFGGQPMERGCELYPGVIAVPVARRGRRWLALLVTLKRKVLAPGNATPAAAGPAAGAESQARPVSLGARVRGTFSSSTLWMPTRGGAGMPRGPQCAPADNTVRH